MIINVTNKNYHDILNWLKHKVGPMIWSRNVVEALGAEWHLAISCTDTRNNRPVAWSFDVMTPEYPAFLQCYHN